MNNACFAVPVHTAKFHYARNLLESYNRFFNDDHIFLIFSNKHEADSFYINNKDLRFNSVVCTVNDLTDNIITIKKYFGVDYIFKNTNFINVGVIDCDSVFIKSLPYDILFKTYVDNKKIYTNLASRPTARLIMTESLKFFNSEVLQNTILQENTCAYFWFNDIPIYHKPWFFNFKEFLNYEEKKREFNHYNFDYIVYGLYLAMTDKIKLEFINTNFVADYSFIEEQLSMSPDIFANVFREIKPMWIKHCIDEHDMVNVFMNLHIDR